MPSTTYLLASLYTTAKTLLVRARTSRGSPQMNKVFRALGVPVSPAIARCFFTVARVDVYSADDFALGRFANDRCRNYARGPMSRRCRSASASICTFVFPPYFFFFFFFTSSFFRPDSRTRIISASSRSHPLENFLPGLSSSN